MTISFDSNVLLAYYQSRTGQTVAGGGVAPTKYAPTPPWQTQTAPTPAALRSALAGGQLIDENAAKLDLSGASNDYKRLFALYQGMSTLSGLIERAQTKGVPASELQRLQTVFGKGVKEVSTYVDSAKFDGLRLTDGVLSTSATAKVGVARSKTEYVTPPLVSGSLANDVAAFQGDVRFTITAQTVNGSKSVDIDLANLGPLPRTLANVINHVNGVLSAAGIASRLATQRIPAPPNTVLAGGKTITLPTGPDQWALRVKTDPTETVSFSAPASAGAVYLAQSAGNPNPDGKVATDDGVDRRELLKFQTDTANLSAPAQPPGGQNWVDGRLFSRPLGPEVDAVRATKVGPDGSVYMLADVSAKTAGQDIKGARDVALMKYDSAGALIYSRTLGAADDASGLSLAVSADGKVAIAGAVKGGLSGAADGALNSGPDSTSTDSFVTLYDDQGQEMWTARRGAKLDDQASQLAFGADGTIYVAGQARSGLPGAPAIGGADGYVEAFKTDAAGKPQALFTQSFGTLGADSAAGLVVDGTSIVVAAVENGHAVLRRFDVSGPAPTLTSTRDLGDLQGGSLAGLALDGGQLVLAGTTRNGALNAGSISRAHAGGTDAFAARLSADLTPGVGDALAYYGGAGDDKATALSAAGGKVWIAGSAGTDLPGQPAVGAKDGFLAGLDLSTGAVDWSRRFTGKDGQAAPSAIAYDPGGATVLDRIGLPNGKLVMKDSQTLMAASSLRPGDFFTIAANGGRPAKITIAANDTLDTLTTKIRRAAGFSVKVDVVVAGNVRKLQIKPANDRFTVELGAGDPEHDALGVLGLDPGVVRATQTQDGKTLPADGKPQIYGLGLDLNINLDDPVQMRHAAAEVATAMGVIRAAYRDLQTAATPKSVLAAQKAANGPVPAYLTNQIANYQAALDRLTGGG